MLFQLYSVQNANGGYNCQSLLKHGWNKFHLLRIGPTQHMLKEVIKIIATSQCLNKVLWEETSWVEQSNKEWSLNFQINTDVDFCNGKTASCTSVWSWEGEGECGFFSEKWMYEGRWSSINTRNLKFISGWFTDAVGNSKTGNAKIPGSNLDLHYEMC